MKSLKLKYQILARQRRYITDDRGLIWSALDWMSEHKFLCQTNAQVKKTIKEKKLKKIGDTLVVDVEDDYGGHHICAGTKEAFFKQFGFNMTYSSIIKNRQIIGSFFDTSAALLRLEFTPAGVFKLKKYEYENAVSWARQDHMILAFENSSDKNGWPEDCKKKYKISTERVRNCCSARIDSIWLSSRYKYYYNTGVVSYKGDMLISNVRVLNDLIMNTFCDMMNPDEAVIMLLQ
jgi:hypothetical protein